MAKIIHDDDGNATGYKPGIIYDIGYIENSVRTPFYVGETHNPEKRLKDHQQAGKNADKTSTLVYQTIHALNEAGIEWTMEELVRYGSEGPTDLEDEWIMKHLFDGRPLKNMNKGSDRWLKERQAVLGDMRKRNIGSYRKYKEILSIEEKQATADRKHAQWLHEEIKNRERQKAKDFFEQFQKQQAELLEIKKIKEAEQKVLRAKREAEEKARWEADRPAREARIRAENARLERLQQEEYEQECIRRQARDIKLKMVFDSLVEKANTNYAEWPDLELRIRYQKEEDAQITYRRQSGWSEDEIAKELEIDRKMSWPPSRIWAN